MEQLNNFDLAGKNIRITTVEEDRKFCLKCGRWLPRLLTWVCRHASSSVFTCAANWGCFFRSPFIDPETVVVNFRFSGTATQHATVDPEVAKQEAIPDFATQCFMLSNMFDPYSETETDWDVDVRDDVIEECNNHGGMPC